MGVYAYACKCAYIYIYIYIYMYINMRVRRCFCDSVHSCVCESTIAYGFVVSFYAYAYVFITEGDATHVPCANVQVHESSSIASFAFVYGAGYCTERGGSSACVRVRLRVSLCASMRV